MAKERIQTSDVKGFGSYTSTPAARGLDTFRGAPQVNKDNTLSQLATALKVSSQTLMKTAVDEEKQKQRLLLAKKEVLAKRIKADSKGKKIDAVKIKELVPEASETTSMAIAEFMGNNQAKVDANNFIERLRNEEPDIFNNKAELDDRVLGERKRLSDMHQGADFYQSGVLQGFDSVISQNNSAWTAQRAQFQLGEAKKYMYGEVYRNLQINGAKAFENGGAIEQLDNKNKRVSPLNNAEMKKQIVDATLELAINNKDTEILTKLPKKYWSGETAGKLQDITNKINKLKFSEFTAKKTVLAHQRKENLRTSKNEIMKNHIEGKTTILDPTNSNYSELEGYRISIMNEGTIPQYKSVAAATKLESSILTNASEGGSMSLIHLSLDNDASESDVIDHIMARNDLHPREKTALIAKVPTLFEGANLVFSTEVNRNYDVGIKEEMAEFMKSAFSGANKALGIRTQSVVKNMYYNTISNQVKAYIETNNKIPKGSDFLEIMEKADARAGQTLKNFILEAGGIVNEPITIL
tara:strand:+ start:5194 stop:6768 length:1575 start_codon:yes stop_codon:yes gene_type:complete